MKKQILTLVSFIALTIGCSSDDNGTTTIPKLLTKVRGVEMDLSDEDQSSHTATTDITYDTNNRILESVSNETSSNGSSSYNRKFVYKDDKLVQIDDYDSDGNLNERTIYEYEGNNVIKKSRYDSNLNLTGENTYTYNANSLLIKNIVINYFNNQSLTTSREYEYLDGKQVKVTNSNNTNYSIITFDNKKSPFSGIPLIEPVLKTDSLLPNNPIKVEEFSNGNLVNSTTITNEYDNDNFLVKKSSGSNDYVITTEYTYNK